MSYRILIPIMLLSFLGSCIQTGEKRSANDFEVPDSLLADPMQQVEEEAMFNIIENLGSPVEIAAMLYDMDIPYAGELPASPKLHKNLNTSFDQALIMGIYSADLGYLNIYGRNNSIVDYLGSIKELADELAVGQFFDFNLLKRLSENKHDLDSLMFVSVHSFNQMNSYLDKTKRTSVSTLVVTGLWIEGMYLATQVAKDSPNEELKESIGEQKIIMEDLCSVLKAHKGQPGFDKLIATLEGLKKEFDNVNITYTEGEPEMMEDENGMLVIIQNEESNVEITEEQVETIRNKTGEIRNHLLSL